MIDFNKTLENDLVILRPMRTPDLEEMYALTNDTDMWIYFTADLSIKSVLENWIAEAIENKNRYALAVIDKTSGAIIGSTSVANISEVNQCCEIGWTWLGKNSRGQGYNPAMKGLLFKYLIEECQFKRVEVKTDVLNLPARTALKKMGVVEEGILRSHTLMTRGRRRDTIYYSILENEWTEIKERNQW